MNVRELIEALQKEDPNAPIGAAIRAVQQKAWEDAQAKMTTREGILAAYPAVLERVTHGTDKHGGSNDKPVYEAYNAIRSEVHEALQFFDPAPLASDLEAMFVSLKSAKAKAAAVHEVQKAHNIELWTKADALVTAAGITEEGVV
jgi:hypothetical protein